MSFLKKHYEKLILTSLLLAFVVLLGFQILTLIRTNDVDIEKIIGIEPPRPDYTSLNQKDSAYNIKSVFFPNGMIWLPNPLAKYGVDLAQAPELALCPSGPHCIPVGDFPQVNDEKNGNCSYCHAILKCRKSVVIVEDDADHDGIPDKYEQANGLNPNDPSDANSDLDEDGFTNLEEYRARTNPRDPKSRPTYAHKLYFTNIERENLPMRLKHFGLAAKGKDTSKWEIQMDVKDNRSGRLRTKFCRLGDVLTVAGVKYKFDSIEENFIPNPKTQTLENNSRLILKVVGGNDVPIIAERGKLIADPRQRVFFLFNVPFADPSKKIACFVGEKFSVGDKKRGIDTFTLISTEPVRIKLSNGRVETVKAASLVERPAVRPVEEGPMDMPGAIKRKTPGMPVF